ncbi:hypothetical protein [Promicromonospora umidemergens]|uniref:hypothetical protein n=1 Tax=Promicromonospora umidemergens TaxID=629679 RepID=UPI0020A469AB|nr:hypothetical protein [Promicromonospora umidemergens]
MTSIESTELAAPVVDALNRVSAAATVPVSVYDERGETNEMYPIGHLAALTDVAARADLLTTTHSTWYAMATWLLHKALTDLDHALLTVPAPVRTALQAELETDAKWLRLALAEYTEGDDLPQDDDRRVWDFGEQFVALVEDGLADRDREMLDRNEASATPQEVTEAAHDLRVLLQARARSSEPDVELDLFGPVVSVDPTFAIDVPDDEERLEVSVHVPVLDPRWRRGWEISLQRWVDDEFDEDGFATASHTEEVLCCELEERPELADVLQLLNQARTSLTDWAGTAIGEVLQGTRFVVTRRAES